MSSLLQRWGAILRASLAAGTLTSLLAADPPQSPITGSEFILNNPPHPSCHASTLVESREGLLVAWFGGSDEGSPDVDIWLSRNEGYGWQGAVEVANGLQESDRRRYPCWNPVLFQRRNGTLYLFYKIGPSPSKWWGMVKSSDNNGRTWSKAKRLPKGILGPVRNKPHELPDGTILCGSSTEQEGWRVYVERTHNPMEMFGGWARSEYLSEAMEFGAIQPTILAYPDGRLQLLCRTKRGKVSELWSENNGATWTRMMATKLPNPNSGIDGVVLRDGRALLVYNHTPSGRSPLNVALSEDGRTWQTGAVLEKEPGEYSYPAIIQTGDSMVHITYTWKRQRIKHVVLDPAKLKGRPMYDGKWVD